jgi:hypothetical protein
MELIDFPSEDNAHSFDWLLSDPTPEFAKPSHFLNSSQIVEAAADLKLCVYLYMANRHLLYINYMVGAKQLFSVFFKEDHPLKEPHPHWNKFHSEAILTKNSASSWNPGYELQRLHLATKIHWTWLEVTWLDCETQVCESGNTNLMKQLNRVR